MKWFVPAVVVLVLEAGFLFSVAVLPEVAPPMASPEAEVVVWVPRAAPASPAVKAPGAAGARTARAAVVHASAPVQVELAHPVRPLPRT